jgi:hypothetical protein
MDIIIQYTHKSITLNIGSYAPIVKIDKIYYLVVRDNNISIDKIILPTGIQLTPTVSCDWLPVSFFEIPKDLAKDYLTFDMLKDNTNCKLYIYDGEEKNEINNLDLSYEKIVDERNCPRFLLYKILQDSSYEKYMYLVDENNKLVAIQYGIEGENKYFIPVYLLKKALVNSLILSLRITKMPLKINNKKIVGGQIFVRALNAYINFDTYMLLEGELNKTVKITYKDEVVDLDYYNVEKINNNILSKEIKDNTMGKLNFMELVNKEY